MKRRVFCACGLTSLLTLACGPGTGCDTPFQNIYVVLLLSNKSSDTLAFSLTGKFDNLLPGENNVSPGEKSYAYSRILNVSGCGGDGMPPAATSIATNMLLIYKSTTSPDQGKVLFGGPRNTYEEWRAKDPSSAFARATLHTDSLFFVPGSQVRQDMGLVVNNPTGTELFTSLDPWRPYKFDDTAPFINIDVHDLDAGDIRMSVTGTLAT